MSVTIVSTPPTPAPAAAADSAAGKTSGDELAAGLDFASLLLGSQRLPVIADVLPKIDPKKDGPEADPATGDAASLLAALGMVAAEPARAVDTATVAAAAAGGDSILPAAGKAGKALLPEALPASKTAAAPATGADGKAEAVATPPTLNVTAADDKPAIFAVAATLATGVEPQPVTAKSAAPDNTQNSQASLAINANNLPANHEVALPLPTPVRDPHWASDFGQKVVWLASNDKQVAQLTLNPPQMGPIEVSLSLDKTNATASFTSANAEVRNAIEAAMPRLREMFASAGIDLGQTNVSAESFRQQAGNGDANRSASHRTADNAILVADPAGATRARGFGVRQGNGMVDIFA